MAASRTLAWLAAGLLATAPPAMAAEAPLSPVAAAPADSGYRFVVQPAPQPSPARLLLAAALAGVGIALRRLRR